MCGICGSTSDPEGVAVKAMCDALRHRGPDGEGAYLEAGGGVALGARRLSVIDLEDGDQPRSNEDGSVRVVFNGEIYNHPTFRRRLEGRGHTLRGYSDTEILPHLYEDYGEDLVHVLEGMFAIAIWDARRERLLLVRDRFGEKPLFYLRRGRDLVFASELTALVTGLGTLPAVNPAALDAFFVLGYVPGEAGSILEGVQQVRPGHLLTWSRASGEIEERPYWKPPTPVAELKEPPQELAAETGRLLEQSIAGRMIADVPLGVFLSGGVDSSVIAAIAARQSRKPLKTFTVGYGRGGGSHDERAASRGMAKLIGSEHREVVMDAEEAATRVPSLLAKLDQPLADPAVVPLHSIAEFARGEVTVAIGGEGADELFGGYPRYTWLGRAPRLQPGHGRAIAGLGRRIPRAGSSSPRALRALELAVPRPLAERHLDWVTDGRRHVRDGLYGPRLRNAHRRDDVVAGLARDLEESRCYSVAGSLMRLDQLHWLPDDVLVKADRAGMLASLELRTPYLQRELAEFATSVAPSTHLSGGGKLLLRLLLKQLVPGAQQRRKVAFLPPIGAWLRGPLRPAMEAQLRDGFLFSEGWVRSDVAAGLFAEHQRGSADRSAVLWPLLAAGLWLDAIHGIPAG
jgi:asparagine synthase (glutamine-hydrolysing)